MSYAIVKSIRIDGDKVIIRAASNNVTPKTYEPWESPSLSRVLREQGETALILELLREYESGMFQPGTPNKYSRAIDYLQTMPEYKAFDWGNKTYKEGCPVEAARQSEAFDALLLKAFAAITIRKPRARQCEFCHGEGFVVPMGAPERKCYDCDGTGNRTPR